VRRGSAAVRVTRELRSDAADRRSVYTCVGSRVSCTELPNAFKFGFDVELHTGSCGTNLIFWAVSIHCKSKGRNCLQHPPVDERVI
jgi:hypothetical protein